MIHLFSWGILSILGFMGIFGVLALSQKLLEFRFSSQSLQQNMRHHSDISVSLLFVLHHPKTSVSLLGLSHHTDISVSL